MEGKAYVIGPTTHIEIKQIEHYHDKLRLLYLEGKEDAINQFSTIMRYLN